MLFLILFASLPEEVEICRQKFVTKLINSVSKECHNSTCNIYIVIEKLDKINQKIGHFALFFGRKYGCFLLGFQERLFGATLLFLSTIGYLQKILTIVCNGNVLAGLGRVQFV